MRAGFRLSRSGEAPEHVYYIDAAVETERILTMLRDDPNYTDLLEGVDPAPATSDAMTLASYVLNRQYQSIDVYEITSVSEDDTALPFFKVRAMGADYSVLGMGRGELSAMYLLWRLEQIPRGAVVILEEPETHLAAVSQRKLTEALVEISAANDFSIILSTHSPSVFDSLPAGQVSLITSLPTMSVVTDMNSRALASRLGLKRSLRCMALTEDLFAAQLLEMIIAHLDRSALDEVGIAFAKDGESGVRAVVAGVNGYKKSGAATLDHRVVGVLDGDQRNEASSDGYAFLPGEFAPEVVVRNRLMGWFSGEEQYLNFSEQTAEKLRDGISNGQGLDHHDWLIAVASPFGGSATLLEIISSFLLQDTGFREEAEALQKYLASI